MGKHDKTIKGLQATYASRTTERDHWRKQGEDALTDARTCFAKAYDADRDMADIFNSLTALRIANVDDPDLITGE